MTQHPVEVELLPEKVPFSKEQSENFKRLTLKGGGGGGILILIL